MGDLGESFRAMRDHGRQVRAGRREKNLRWIEKVTGFKYRQLTPYQFRFSADDTPEFIDIYPTNARYHNIVTGERGHYKTIQRFLELQLDRTLEFKANQQGGANNES